MSAAPLATPQQCRLFVWNWLPARYAAEHQWQEALGPLPRPRFDSREERALSVWLLRRNDLHSRAQRALPPFPWLLCTPAFLQAKALDAGLASHAGALSRLMARGELLAVRSALGPNGHERATRLAKQHPELAALHAHWQQRLDPHALRRTGIALMLALLADLEPGLRERFVLRLDAACLPAAEVPELAPEVRDDLAALLAEDALAHADPCFEWELPAPIASFMEHH